MVVAVPSVCVSSVQLQQLPNVRHRKQVEDILQCDKSAKSLRKHSFVVLYLQILPNVLEHPRGYSEGRNKVVCLLGGKPSFGLDLWGEGRHVA